MYGLLLAVTTGGVALAAPVVNRVAITVVEAGTPARRRAPRSLQETLKKR